METSPALKGKKFKIIPESTMNMIIVVAEPAVVKQIASIIEENDEGRRRAPSGAGGAGGSSGGSSSSSGGLLPVAAEAVACLVLVLVAGAGAGGGGRGDRRWGVGPGAAGMSIRGSTGPMMGGGMMPPGGVSPRAAAIKVVSLKHAAAPDLSSLCYRECFLRPT